MKEPVVVAQNRDASIVGFADHESGWKYLFLLGAAMALANGLDMVINLYPVQLASLNWEMNSIAGIAQNMPGVSAGIGLMSAAAVANGGIGSRRMVMVLNLVLATIVVLLTLVFMLDTLTSLKTTDVQMRLAVKAIGIRTCLLMFTYFVLYLALGVWTWRRLRALKGAQA